MGTIARDPSARSPVGDASWDREYMDWLGGLADLSGLNLWRLNNHLFKWSFESEGIALPKVWPPNPAIIRRVAVLYRLAPEKVIGESGRYIEEVNTMSGAK